MLSKSSCVSTYHTAKLHAIKIPFLFFFLNKILVCEKFQLITDISKKQIDLDILKKWCIICSVYNHHHKTIVVDGKYTMPLPLD